MTPLICSSFYVYFILSVNYYRKEIKMRIDDGYKHNSKFKSKAPRSVRTTVLLIFVATSINFLAYAIYKEFIIIANVLPAAVCIFIHSHYQRKIIKMDRLED